ncbi:hypothetical protein AX17_002151 [Amanita inopinata Kibby_2008]|nr:hypothetical protein AX17_002151 [Amanita inopinata Kibby_2008]
MERAQSNQPPGTVRLGLETTNAHNAVLTNSPWDAKLPPKMHGGLNVTERLLLDPNTRKCMESQRALEEDSVTIQRLVLGSTLVTCGAGMNIQSIICGFDNSFIKIRNLPLDVQEKEIEALFTSADLSREAFCVTNTRQYGDGTIIATAIVRRGMGQIIVDWLNGQRIRNNALKSVMAKITPKHKLPQHRVLAITWDPRLLTQYAPPFLPRRHDLGGPAFLPNERHTYSPYGSTTSLLTDFDTSLKENLETMPGFKCFKLSPNHPPHARTAIVLFETPHLAEQAHGALAGKRLRCYFPVLRCTLQPLSHALYIPLEQYNDHERNGTTEYEEYTPMLRELRRSDIGTVNDANSGGDGLKVRAAYLSGHPFTGWLWSWDRGTTEMLDRIQEDPNVLVVERCWMTKALKLYALSETALATTEKLSGMAAHSSSAVSSFPIARHLVQSLHEGNRLAELKRELGEDQVWLDVSCSEYLVKYRGTCRNFFAVSQLLEQIKEGHLQHSNTRGGPDCPICLDKVSTPVELSCKHTYCVACLRGYLISTQDTNRFPIVCVGNDNQCCQPLSIPIIQSLLSPLEFNSLVDKTGIPLQWMDEDAYVSILFRYYLLRLPQEVTQRHDMR